MTDDSSYPAGDLFYQRHDSARPVNIRREDGTTPVFDAECDQRGQPTRSRFLEKSLARRSAARFSQSEIHRMNHAPAAPIPTKFPVRPGITPAFHPFLPLTPSAPPARLPTTSGARGTKQFPSDKRAYSFYRSTPPYHLKGRPN